MSRNPGSEPLTGRDWLLGLLTFVGFWIALAVALMGAWVATSLTVFHDGPTWLAIVGAALCFLVIPLVWELLADRRQVGGRFTDTILRSGALSAVFLIVVVATHPESTFKALATRGDWFLSSPRTAERDGVRTFLWTVANGFEWLYDAVRTKAFDLPPGDPDLLPEDVYVAPGAPVTPKVSDRTVELPTSTTEPVRPEPPSQPEPPTPTATRTIEWPIPGSTLSWPLAETPHPAATSVPDDATTVASIGRYLAAQEPDPLLRARAVHDVVATRIAYSARELRDGSYKRMPQTAEAVLKRGTAVCAGYARLMVALGRAAGLNVVYVSGDARSFDDLKEHEDAGSFAAQSGGHAWNAVEIDTRWYLLDATWDAGHVAGDAFERRYRTTYLFVPPEVMIFDHRPEASRFQLLARPLDMATWWRQPFIRPEAAALGLGFGGAFQVRIPVSGTLRVEVDNPLGLYLSLGIESDGGETSSFCGGVKRDTVARLACDLGKPGRYSASVFASRKRYGTYLNVAETLVDVSD